MPQPRAVLLTGGAGFIGSHLVDRLLAEHWQVTVLDNFDPYYGEAAKRRNIAAQMQHPRYRLIEADIRDPAQLAAVKGDFDLIVHLAAKAGVRASLLDPVGYQQTNVLGTAYLLELARQRGVRRFVFGSSSSVYGDCPRLPWREDDPDLIPLNPYASSKLAGEHLARVYAELFGLQVAALRFFTVIGPRQRPDLAIHKFARRILAGQPIPVFGDGHSARDYTYVDDIVAGIRAAMDADQDGYQVYNLGNSHTVTLAQLVASLEDALGRHAVIDRQPWQPGEMQKTWSDISKARQQLGFEPKTSFSDGLLHFVGWLHDTLQQEAAT